MSAILPPIFALFALLFLADPARAHPNGHCPAGQFLINANFSHAESDTRPRCVSLEVLEFADWCFAHPNSRGFIRELRHRLFSAPPYGTYDACQVRTSGGGNCGPFFGDLVQGSNISCFRNLYECPPGDSTCVHENGDSCAPGEVCYDHAPSRCPPGQTYVHNDQSAHQCGCPPDHAYRADLELCLEELAAPIISRPVAADFQNETFTLYWRPPETGEGGIQSYRIRRVQATVAADSNPAACDSLAENEYADSAEAAITLTNPSQWYSHTAAPGGEQRTAGETHGTCYRWHIAAVDPAGPGREAATDPILSRGYLTTLGGVTIVHSYDDTIDDEGNLCPAGQHRTYGQTGWNAACAVLADSACDSAAYSEFSADHRECQCVGWATPAEGADDGSPGQCECNLPGADANCECRPELPYMPEEFHCGEPLDREILINPSPSPATIAALLRDGADPNGTTGEIPRLIVAATLGHAQAVSVLITAGAHPQTADPSYLQFNVAHHMASRGRTTLSRAQQWNVLQNFGGGLAQRRAAFNWSATDANGRSPLDHLALEARAPDADEDLALVSQMSDYILARGGTCIDAPSLTLRYHSVCVGTLAMSLVALITQTLAAPSAADVRAAALAMTEAGVSPDVAGTPQHGHLAAVAARNLYAEALSVLLSVGMNPKGEGPGERQPLHYIAAGMENRATLALETLRHFLGGLSAANALDSFDGWNETASALGGKTPLDSLQDFAARNNDAAAEKDEARRLLYHRGARCQTESGKYCEVPANETRISGVDFVGDVLTLYATALDGFRRPPISDSALAELTLHGWDLRLDENPNPDEVILSRSRVVATEDAPAVFTVTLTSAAANDARHERVWATAVAATGASELISLARGGNADDISRFLNDTASVNLHATDENGVPPLVIAAARGHGEAVSVLVTFGFNPDARHPGRFNMNIPMLMSAPDGTEALNDGAELTRERRWSVLQFFTAALAERTDFTLDWNARDARGNHPTRLLELSRDRSGLTTEERAAEKPTLLLMADHMLARGMRCSGGNAARYSEFCVGGAGKTLADAIANSESDANVRAAARTMVDAGIPLEVSGNPSRGHLIGVAALNRRASAVSILITFGMSPHGRANGLRLPELIMGELRLNTSTTPMTQLPILDHFIGGMRVAGVLQNFRGWNGGGGSNPLDQLQHFVTNSATRARAAGANQQAALAEMHALLYEHGTRCVSNIFRNQVRPYCFPPMREFSFSKIRRVQPLTTLHARDSSGFHNPPVSGAVSVALSNNGWGLELNAEPEPDALVFSRVRVPRQSDSSAIFTVTLTNWLGTATRFTRISASAEDALLVSLVDATREGDHATAARILNGAPARLTNATDDSGAPLLIVAATLGHSEMVSVLVSFGFDPDERHAPFHNSNIAHLMAASDGTTLELSQRTRALRYFNGGIAARGASFDWNAENSNPDANARTPMNILREEWDDASPNRGLVYEMAHYLLSVGASCAGETHAQRYGPPCVGAYGVTLAALISRAAGSPPSADETREAARAVVDAGINLSVVGDPDGGALIGLGAQRGHALAVSVLLTLGADPAGRGGADARVNWTALHHIAAGAEDSAPAMLNLLRHFIGGLLDSGTLASFASANLAANPGADERFPLDVFQEEAMKNQNDLADKREMHSLFFELSAQCRAASAPPYCETPGGDFHPGENVLELGVVLTVTARALSGFPSPQTLAAIETSLAANGWGFAQNAAAEPDEITLSRRRIWISTDLPAVFTLTLTNTAGQASRRLRVAATAALNADYASLFAAVRRGDAAETTRRAEALKLPRYLDAEDENNVPPLLLAAGRGHAEVVSVLITLGANPLASLAIFYDVGVPHLMGTFDGTEMLNDGAEISRAMRWNVLRHFGDALSVRGTVYDWNTTDRNGNRPLNLTRLSESFGVSAEDAAIIGEMANYILARGGRCNPDKENNTTRYDNGCIGPLGVVLGSIVNRNEAPEPDEVRRAAQAMLDAGIDPDIAGASKTTGPNAEEGGHVVWVATRKGWARALSVLLTFGLSPDRSPDGRAAPHVAAEGAAGDMAGLQATMLQYFIGGLSESGRLADYDKWNAPDDDGDRPLDILQDGASAEERHREFVRETHSLLYENGAECASPEEKEYCQTPREERSALNVARRADILTLAARGVEGESFSLPLGGAVNASLLAEFGWALTLRTDANPDRVVLSRERGGRAGDMSVSFTIFLTAQGRTIREYRVEASSASPDVFPDCNDDLNRKWSADGAFCVECLREDLAPRASDAEGRCEVRPRVEYAAIPSDGTGGTLTAEIESGGLGILEATITLAALEATITLAAVPAAGFYVSLWLGDGADCETGDASAKGDAGGRRCVLRADADLFVTVVFQKDCAGEENRHAVSHDECGECMDNYPTKLNDNLCVNSTTGDFGGLRQADICGALGGRTTAEGACVDADQTGTFCILNSEDAFPCRGFFRHIVRCNLEYERPALNPFICGVKCSEGTVRGGECP